MAEIREKLISLKQAAELSGATVIIREQTRPPHEVITPFDRTPPLPFEPVRDHVAELFGDDWFVSFVAQDMESGIERYEVAEWPGPPLNDTSGLAWEVTQSPHLLKDQSLMSSVYVRAIDRAGNIRLAVLPPVAGVFSQAMPHRAVSLELLLTLMVIALLFWYSYLIHRRRSPEAEPLP